MTPASRAVGSDNSTFEAGGFRQLSWPAVIARRKTPYRRCRQAWGRRLRPVSFVEDHDGARWVRPSAWVIVCASFGGLSRPSRGRRSGQPCLAEVAHYDLGCSPGDGRGAALAAATTPQDV